MATTLPSASEHDNVTSGQDIIDLISNCADCKQITNGGNYVISYIHLPNLVLPKRPKIGIIVNTEHDDSSDIGHWFLCYIHANHTMILADGLNQVESKKPEVLKAVTAFCYLNNLIYTSLDIRCQLESSSTCGYICCFFLAKASLLSLKGLLLLRETMKRNSIHTNEAYAIHFVRKHFIDT